MVSGLKMREKAVRTLLAGKLGPAVRPLILLLASNGDIAEYTVGREG